MFYFTCITQILIDVVSSSILLKSWYNVVFLFSILPPVRNQLRPNILSSTMSLSYTCFSKEEVSFLFIFVLVLLIITYIKIWWTKVNIFKCLVILYSRYTSSQVVWSWRGVQCHGYWPSWTKSRRLVQLL